MNDYLILYILHHNACNAGAESTEIPAPDDEWNIVCMPQAQNTLCITHELLKLLCSIWNDAVMCITYIGSNLIDEAISYIRNHNGSQYLPLTT